MKRGGPCVHQQNLRASASGAAHSTTHTTPAPRRNVATAACLRLYAEGQELQQHKELLYSKFGLQKAPVRKATMGSTTTSSRELRGDKATAITSSARPLSSQHLTAKTGVNQSARSTNVAAKRASVQSSGTRAVNSAGSPTKDRQSSTVYVPPGGRSPTATTMKQVFAKTYSLQSTLESRAAVAPRRKANTTRRPSSPKSGTAKRDQSPGRPSSTSASSVGTAKARRISTACASVCRGRTPDQQKQPDRLKQVNNRSSIATASPEMIMARGSRASMVSPRPNPMVGRRPSTAPIQQPPQKTRTFSTIFQQQQQRQDPVLVQVSRRTSSPIMSPAGPGGRRRPSVAPIGPVLSPARGGSSNSDTGNPVSSPGSGSSPRASFIRRENKLEKLQEQVNVLKASLGISDEDLQWKVESAKGNAFLVADQRLAACEERYDRLVFEMQELSQPARCADEDKANVALAAKLRSLEKQAQQVAELKARATTYQSDMVQTKKHLLAARVEAELQRAKQDSNAAASAAALELATSKRLESIKEGLLAAQQQLKTEQGVLQTLLEWLGTETDRFGTSLAAEDLSPSPVSSEQTLEAKRSLLYTLRTIPECTQGSGRLSTLCSQATQLAAKITASRAHDLKRTEAELERTMRDVEIWKTRREQAKEFAQEMRKREAEWQASQRDKNEESLALLRTFIPSDIADLSVESIIARAHQGCSGVGSGVLYTYDLAAYLKTNRFLHWLVTHEDDIARANFLAIESAPFFMDFANYDINELRALARVLPDTFAFDKDGRKNAWRTSFIEHVRQLTAQQQHETIKAGWDPVKRARRDVQLPELTARQQLNPIFCYPTDAEIDTRVNKFERQRARLESKRARLKKLDEEFIPQAKAEYVAVAEDARNEDLQHAFGKATLIALREEAKQQHLALCKERDAAKSELAHGERAWAAMTPSFEQYKAEVAQIRALDPEIRNAPRIQGPFPACIDLQPRERAAFKKLSVEEEAEARKRELDSAIAKRSHDISEVVVTEENYQTTAVPEVASVVLSLTEAEMEAIRLMQLEDKILDAITEPIVTPETLTEPPAPPPRGFRRIKSLQVAVGVLQFLEKDFCSPKRVMRGKEDILLSPSRKQTDSEEEKNETSAGTNECAMIKTPRSSRSMPSTPRIDNNSGKEDDTKDAKPTPVIPPKSKALLKLLEARKAQENDDMAKPENQAMTPPRPSPFGGKPNFLGELQNRFQRKPGNAEVATSNSEIEISSIGLSKPTNFLEELKNASTRKSRNENAGTNAVSNAPVNFLDELKKKNKARIEKGDLDDTLPLQTLRTPDSASTGPPTPRNFLIK
ncbi:unnamed protein product [Phytophthora lilii]|uniref:Unnamed protein product n=1 Tax=Phytophthora lilii TaxID=2077276 RepID=A0A9W6TXD9_9STRA|nr:unnamed protein product [Phytophthora lilii]